jgi:hypothetical protein
MAEYIVDSRNEGRTSFGAVKRNAVPLFLSGFGVILCLLFVANSLGWIHVSPGDAYEMLLIGIASFALLVGYSYFRIIGVVGSVEYNVDVRDEGRVAFSRSVKGKIIPFSFCVSGFLLCLVFIVNILYRLHIPADDAYSMLGIGLALFSLGCYLFPSNAPSAFIIDTGKGTVSFYERGELTLTPLSSYKRLEVSPAKRWVKILDLKSSIYVVDLIRTNGATFTICRYRGRDRAVHCVESIARVSGLPAFVDGREIVKGRKLPAQDINEILSAKGTLRKELHGDSTHYSWRSRRSNASAFSVCGILIGIASAVCFGILPDEGFAVTPVLGISIFTLMAFVGFFLTAFSFAGSYTAVRKGSSVFFTTSLFGMQLRTLSLNGLFSARATAGGEGNGVMLFNREAENSFIKKGAHRREIASLPRITGFRSRETDRLFIDGKSLTYGEKLLLERELNVKKNRRN